MIDENKTAEKKETQNALNTLLEQKEPQTAAYSMRLIVVVCLVVVGLLFGMFYVLSSNILLKPEDQLTQSTSTIPNGITPTISVPVSIPPIEARFEIITGSVYRTLPGEQRKLLVDKEELQLPKDLNLKVLEIVSYKVSPDMSTIVVMANVGLTPYALFYKNLQSGEIYYIELGQDAAWSADNRYIALRTGKTDIGPYAIVVYDTQTKKMADLVFSKQLDPENTTYGDVLWSMDKPEIVAEYSLFSDYPYSQQEQGTVTIKVR